MVRLRDYQQDAIDVLVANAKKGIRKQVLVAPTGAGKGWLIAWLASIAKGRVLVIADRIELVEDVSERMVKLGVKAEFLNANNRPKNLNSKVYVSMAQTLTRRLSDEKYIKYLQEVSLVIIDEAHKTIFDKFHEHIKNKVIGMTATPIREGNQTSLDELYDCMHEVATVQQLIDKGALCPARSFSTPVDLSKVKTSGNDFDRSEMTNFYDKTELYTGAVKNYLRHAKDEKTILFCSGVKNSIKLKEEFLANGISAEHLDSENCSSEERKRVLKDFKEGKIKVLCNVGLFLVGFDEPSVTCVILYRATKSLSLFLQACGRGSRLHEGKDHFKILDFGENFQRFGLWESPREWSLKKQKRERRTKGASPVKECKRCEAIVMATDTVCPCCGYQFPTAAQKRKEVEVYLREIETSYDRLNPYPYFQFLDEKAKSLGKKNNWVLSHINTKEQLTQYAQFRGYNKNWVCHRMRFRKYE